MNNQENDDSSSTYKKAGVMSEAQRKMRNSNIDAIKRNWNIDDFLDFFPDSIRPQSLGNSAVSCLRSISNKATKSVAETLFLHECQKPDGGYNIAGFSHAQRILKTLIENDNSPKPKSKTKLGGKASKKAHEFDALDSSPRPAPKRASVDKYPTGRIPKKNSIGPNGPEFTPINKSMPASPNDADQFVDLTYDDDDEDESPSLKNYDNGSNHLKHGRGPKPGPQDPSLSYQTPYSHGGNVGTHNQGQNGSLPKRGRLDLNKGAPSTVLKNSERENKLMDRQSNSSDKPAGNSESASPVTRRDNEISVKKQTASLLTPKETLGGNEDKIKETGANGEMDHEKDIDLETERLMMEREITREREKQKLRDLTLGSSTISSAPAPFTYTPPVFPDAVSRNVKAQSADAVSTKRPFEDEEEIGDTIIVDTPSQPPAKRRKAGSAPLEHTEFSSSPPVAPVAPMMGPVESPLANKRTKASPVPFEDKYLSAPLDQMNPTTKTETITTPPKTESPLSPEQNVPIAPMHTPTTPVNDPQRLPTPTKPVEGTSAKKEGKVKKTGANLNDSYSRTSRKARAAMRAINVELLDVAKVGDARGEAVMQAITALLQKTAEELKEGVEALIEKHGLTNLRENKGGA